MPQQGRPRIPGTEEERAAARREKVRENVRAHRRRQRERRASEQSETPPEAPESSQIHEFRPTKPAPELEESEIFSEPESIEEQNAIEGHDTRETQSAPAAIPSVLPLVLQYPRQRFEVTFTSQGNQVTWDVPSPMRFEVGPSYAGAFVAAFHDRSTSTVPRSEDLSINETMRIEICCYTWTTILTIQAVSGKGAMFKDALLATALCLLSTESNNRDMAMQAMMTQERALRSLRREFELFVYTQDPQKAALLSATAIACSISELVLNKSWEGFAIHLKGIGALMMNAGPASLSSTAARDDFYGFRALQAPFSFLERKSRFLTQPEWTNFSWKETHPAANHPMHTLLDIAFQIPVQMELHDNTPNHNQAESLAQLAKIEAIISQLDAWHKNLIATYSNSIYTLEPAIWTGLQAEIFNFHNEAIAISYTLYTGVLISAFSLFRQVAEGLKDYDERVNFIITSALDESLKWSRIACQCLEYFFARGQGVVGKTMALFPFDCAWMAFLDAEGYGMDVRAELAWCKEFSQTLIGMGLLVLRVRRGF